MIKSLKFDAHHTGWHLRGVGDGPAEFGAFQLLVGLSGAGKSRTLEAIHSICRVATGRHTSLYDCEWFLGFEVENQHLKWHAKTDVWGPSTIDSDDAEKSSPRFLSERLYANDKLILSRSVSELILHDQRLPQIKDTESAISLFRNAPVLKPAFDMFSRLDWSDTRPPIVAFRPDNLEKLLEAASSAVSPELGQGKLAALRALSLPLYLKSYLLNRDFPEPFLELAASYKEIFPTVTELGFGLWSEYQPEYQGPPTLVFAIREAGVPRWVVGPRMSEGMITTLLRLLEDMVGPDNTVRLIDEVENSLGVNCLDAVAETLHPTRGRQTIATSHHPYIIGNISPEHWLVVQRRGDTVHLVPATSIPRLQTASHQDLFTQLINTPEYLEGIR